MGSPKSSKNFWPLWNIINHKSFSQPKHSLRGCERNEKRIARLQLYFCTHTIIGRPSSLPKWKSSTEMKQPKTGKKKWPPCKSLKRLHLLVDNKLHSGFSSVYPYRAPQLIWSTINRSSRPDLVFHPQIFSNNH